MQGRDEVGHPVAAPALPAGAESAEQIEVGQHPVELVDGETSGVVVLARSGAWEVQRAGAWVGSEPVADVRQVTASPVGGESEGVAHLRAGDASRVEREVGEEFDVERLAVGDRFGLAGGPRVHGSEQDQLGQRGVGI